ncbi:nucleoside triphosphate pyrophosphohydrolase [Thermodesulfobacteriota bacterium]
MGAELNEKETSLGRLVDLVATLRGEKGCPWDRNQTPDTMKVYLLEEVHELLDALSEQDPEHVREELGDVLFQLIFLARIYEERRAFDIGDVARVVENKMVRRHPHVFGDEKVTSAEDVRKRWNQFKGSDLAGPPMKNPLDSVPSSLPSLLRAYRIIERASRAGFDPPDIQAVTTTVEEKWNDLQRGIDQKDKDRVSSEMGDLLFALVGLSRLLNLHPETALRQATNDFKHRFRSLKKASEKGSQNEQGIPSGRSPSTGEGRKKNHAQG